MGLGVGPGWWAWRWRASRWAWGGGPEAVGLEVVLERIDGVMLASAVTAKSDGLTCSCARTVLQSSVAEKRSLYRM